MVDYNYCRVPRHNINTSGRRSFYAVDSPKSCPLCSMLTGVPPFEVALPSQDHRCRVIAIEERLAELLLVWRMPLSLEVRTTSVTFVYTSYLHIYICIYIFVYICFYSSSSAWSGSPPRPLESGRRITCFCPCIYPIHFVVRHPS